MAMMLKIVTPDRLAFDGEAERVMVRTVLGDVAILPNHAEFSAALAIGIARVTANGETRLAAVNGGMITVVKNQVSIIAITFEWADEIDPERARRAEAQARETLGRAGTHDRDFQIADAKLKRAIARIQASNR